jgi:hypothetical protein
MATLTETAYFTRNTIKWGFISLVAFVILKIGYMIFSSAWTASHPPPPPPPTVSFGTLPIIDFIQFKPVPIASSSALTYTVETVEGKTVKLPTAVKVYFSPQIPSNVLALDRAKERAVKLGFTLDPFKLTPEIYSWTDPNNQWRTFTMNIYTGNFVLSYNFLADQSLVVDKNVPDLQNAFVESKNFLDSLDIDTKELEPVESINFQGNPRAGQFLKFSVSQLTSATSQSDADAVQVFLQKKKLDDLPFYTVDPNGSLISFIYSGQKDSKKHILEALYTNFPIEKEVFATYPVKTFEEALTNLKDGKGFIARKLGDSNSITIRKAYLAYFDAPLPQNYLQPIIVFEGDNSFVAYVQAVSDKWLQ